MSTSEHHTARQQSPARFEQLKRATMKGLPEGVDLICGIRNGSSPEIQAIRFQASTWTPDAAKAWLRDNGFSAAGFKESASWQASQLVIEGASETPEGKQVKLLLDVVKTYEMKVFGWLYVCRDLNGEQVVDHSGEVVSIGTLEKASYGYVAQHRKACDMHARAGDGSVVDAGYLIECVVFTPEKRVAMAASLGLADDTLHKVIPDAMWVGYQFTNKDTWADILSGKKPALSFGGRARRVPLNNQQGVQQ